MRGAGFYRDHSILTTFLEDTLGEPRAGDSASGVAQPSSMTWQEWAATTTTSRYSHASLKLTTQGALMRRGTDG